MELKLVLLQNHPFVTAKTILNYCLRICQTHMLLCHRCSSYQIIILFYGFWQLFSYSTTLALYDITYAFKGVFYAKKKCYIHGILYQCTYWVRQEKYPISCNLSTLKEVLLLLSKVKLSLTQKYEPLFQPSIHFHPTYRFP
jgi:hypothetical protein